MKHLQLAVCAALAGAALIAGTSQAAPGDPGAGLAMTLHDFTIADGQPGGAANSTEVGLCTFCHTPHKAQSTKLLWNHVLSANSFSWSDASTTTGGTTLAIDKTYQGASVRCLSCHDGSVAIGDVAWFAEQPRSGATTLNPNKIGTDLLGAVAPQEFQIATATGDLKGNHPIAVPFPYNNNSSTYNGVPTGNGVVLSEWQPDPTTSGIRLFTDDGSGHITAGVTAGKTGIECSSCHDPHNGKTVPGTSDFFLRGNYTGSDSNYLCLKCHKK